MPIGEPPALPWAGHGDWKRMMADTAFGQTAARDRVGLALSSPATHAPPPLGKPGYELPAIEAFEWHSVGPKESDNWIVAPATLDWSAGRNFRFGPEARGNVIILDHGCATVGNTYIVGSDNTAIIIGGKTGRHPIGLQFKSNASLFYWGNGATSNSNTFILAGGPADLIVGAYCMFASGIVVRTHDEHGIIDLETGATLNPAQTVLIEPSVWVGENAKILKGVTLGFGCIVGAGSIVTRSVPRNALVAGVPARVLRRNVGWTRDAQPSADAAARIKAFQRSLDLDHP